VKIGQLFPDLLSVLGRARSPEDGLAQALRQLVRIAGASAGVLVFTPGRGPATAVVAGARPDSPLDAWLRRESARPARAARLDALGTAPPGWRQRRGAVLLRAPLGEPARPSGRLLLLGPAGRGGLTRERIPGGFPREFGHAVEQVWRLHRRTVRLEVINEVTRLAATTLSLEAIYEIVALQLGRLVSFESITIALLDRERAEVRVVALQPGVADALITDRRVPLADTLTEQVVRTRAPARVDDLRDEGVPAASRSLLEARGMRSAVLAPLIATGEVIGTLNAAHSRPGAFGDEDLEVLTDVARPLAAAVEHARLHHQTLQRAEALGALNRTAQLITARLDVGSVLETISRAVTSLTGGTGCGIGLLSADGATIDHVAAHGVHTPEWRTLSMAVGEGIIGTAVATQSAIRVDDVRTDPRSAKRDVDEKEGIRSLLSVPLRVGGTMIGVVSAYSTSPDFFSAADQVLLETFAEQAAIAIHNARLFEESQRRARETQALLEAGRAVRQSLDLEETIRVILHHARAVLGVQSCGIFTLDEATGELASVASLDLDPSTLGRLRVRVGEGVTGRAVAERRPLQSENLPRDPGAARPDVARATGLPSMLAVPLLVGERAIGALTLLRADLHRFTPDEEALASALADQAALALEHARLFRSVRTYSERLEAMVAERTAELDEQRRFVEVVLETLPLGLCVLDRSLQVIRANEAAAAALGREVARGARLLDLVEPPSAAVLRDLLEAAFAGASVQRGEHDLVVAAGDPRTLRLTAAPLRSPGDVASHAILVIEDVTLPKRLERQMLLTERLTTAGRMVAGVAHEMNNPLATIAGCAEALRERAADPALADLDAFKDFAPYLALIEEEAYRCKEFTSGLLQFVRDPGSRRLPVDLNGLVEKTLDLLRHQPRFAASTMAVELDAELPLVPANEGQLRQVFLGLAANALEAMDGRGRLAVRTRRRGAHEVEVVFTDSGPGIPREILGRIFDPFFTTKPPGQGTGLGLAIAQGLVTDHGGRIDVTSRPGEGATFRVILPGDEETARP